MAVKIWFTILILLIASILVLDILDIGSAFEYFLQGICVWVLIGCLYLIWGCL